MDQPNTTIQVVELLTALVGFLASMNLIDNTLQDQANVILTELGVGFSEFLFQPENIQRLKIFLFEVIRRVGPYLTRDMLAKVWFLLQIAGPTAGVATIGGYATYVLFQKIFGVAPGRNVERQGMTERELENARRQLNIDTKNFYNIAFVGHAKTGKSTLINAIRGIPNSSRTIQTAPTGFTDVAPTGFVTWLHTFFTSSSGTVQHAPTGSTDSAPTGFTNCTSKVAYYMFHEEHNMKHIRLYDVPGCATPENPAKTYFHKYGLAAFDLMVILCQDSVCIEEIKLANEARNKGLPVCFIKSRCDTQLENKAKEIHVDPNEALKRIEEADQTFSNEVLAQIKEGFDRVFTRYNLNDIPCYYVSGVVLRTKVAGISMNYGFEEEQFLEYIAVMAITRAPEAVAQNLA